MPYLLPLQHRHQLYVDAERSNSSQCKNLRKKIKYYLSLKNLFSLSRSRHVNRYKEEVEGLNTAHISSVEQNSRRFDVKAPQMESFNNDYKSMVSEEKMVMNALNSSHDISSHARSMRAKMAYDNLLSRSESASSRELIQRFMSSQKLGESLRGHQNLAESRVAQLRLENSELIKTWSEIQYAMGLQIKEGNKIDNDEKDSRNLEQNLEKVGLTMVHEARLAVKSSNLINDAKAGVQHIVEYLDSNSKLLKNIPSSIPPTILSDDDIIRALAWCEERVIAVNEALVLDASKPAGIDDSKPLPDRQIELAQLVQGMVKVKQQIGSQEHQPYSGARRRGGISEEIVKSDSSLTEITPRVIMVHLYNYYLDLNPYSHLNSNIGPFG